MRAFTCHREESLVLGGTIRVLVLHHDENGVRLGIDAPPPVDVARDGGAVVQHRRHDLIAWHSDPQWLIEQIAARYPAAADDVRCLRTGVAWFGTDPCLLPLLEAYIQGLCDGRSDRNRHRHFVRNIPS